MTEDPAFIDPSEPVERQNERLLKITQSLIRRVERDTDETGNAYSLFQRAVALEGEVRARTHDLERTLSELNRVNGKLEAATAVADEANRAKTRFLAAASHDVLQPLNAAKLFIGTLEDTDLDDRQKRITGRIRTAFDSVEALLGALLDISKLDTAGASAEIVTMPLSQIFEPIATEFAPIAKEKGIGFSVIPSSALIESDPSHLRRIVQNLVSNAVRYCDTGRVLVGGRRRSGKIAIEIYDTGPGIKPELIPEIFREFHRIPSASGATDQGMGLGLAIVDRACRLLGHPIDIRTTPGRGSLFAVSVPLVLDASSGSRDRSGHRHETDSMTGMIALAVHGDLVKRGVLVDMLEHWGASVIGVPTLDKAVQACEQLGLPPDIMLVGDSDAGVVSNSIKIIRSIHGPEIPVVILSDGASHGPEQDFVGVQNIAFADPNQPHRLRALLTWTRRQSHIDD